MFTNANNFLLFDDGVAGPVARLEEPQGLRTSLNMLQLHKIINRRTMRYEKPWKENSRSPEDTLLDEVSTAMRELVRDKRGAYSETLSIRANGHIDAGARPQDSRPPFLPRIFLEVDGSGHGLQGPTIEQFYQLVSDLQQRLPDLAFEVSESPDRKTIKYTVRDRSQVTPYAPPKGATRSDKAVGSQVSS
jgi:hypothetical protein